MLEGGFCIYLRGKRARGLCSQVKKSSQGIKSKSQGKKTKQKGKPKSQTKKPSQEIKAESPLDASSQQVKPKGQATNFIKIQQNQKKANAAAVDLPLQ